MDPVKDHYEKVLTMKEPNNDRKQAGSVPAMSTVDPNESSSTSRRHSAESSTSSIAVTVVNSLVTGATAVSNYVWSFWAPPHNAPNGMSNSLNLWSRADGDTAAGKAGNTGSGD
jgi:hypothetical protein